MTPLRILQIRDYYIKLFMQGRNNPTVSVQQIVGDLVEQAYVQGKADGKAEVYFNENYGEENVLSDS